MNEFMNALYNAEGSTVTGYRDGVPFIGVITDVRAKSGNSLSVTVATEAGYDIIINSNYFLYESAPDNLFTNLHCYFDNVK